MADYTTRDAIEIASNGNTAEFKNAINSLLRDKVQDSIELKRMEVAGKFMSATETDEVDSGDTDVENTEV